MKTTEFKQTKKIGVAGSFVNQMYGNNNSIPVVGEYCTFLHYTDRSVGIVREFKDNMVVIEKCNTQADGNTKNDMGHQNWVHIPSGNLSKYIYKNGEWKSVSEEVVFTKEFIKSIPDEFIGIWLRKNNPELANKIYNGNHYPSVVIDGITRIKKSYNKISIIFGVCDYYYDWSF